MAEKECLRCIHKEVCKTAESCDGFVSGCKHFNPGWISVKDRLPEKEGFYLVVTKYGTVYRELYFLGGDPPEPSFGWDGVSNGKYTHWMPLPQPPKGE